jgi:hypothetical protein
MTVLYEKWHQIAEAAAVVMALFSHLSCESSLSQWFVLQCFSSWCRTSYALQIDRRCGYSQVTLFCVAALQVIVVLNSFHYCAGYCGESREE